jgi:hypothetical protein
VDGPGTLAALTPGEAGEVLTMQRGRMIQGQHSHASLRLYHRQGYRRTHATQAGAYPLVHLAKSRPRRPGAAPFRLGRS